MLWFFFLFSSILRSGTFPYASRLSEVWRTRLFVRLALGLSSTCGRDAFHTCVPLPQGLLGQASGTLMPAALLILGKVLFLWEDAKEEVVVVGPYKQ